MNYAERDITTLWATMAVDELIRSGVKTFVVSPGSRSTPLALAIGADPRADIVAHLDERGAAFFAIGYARATHKPAVLLCTSGTAVANYFPAVIEASLDNLPLIIVSADRPPESLDTGANQTIAQDRIFGDFCRWRYTIPCPTEEIRPEFVLTTIDQAVFRAQRTPARPVHLNFQFREPLIPRLDAPVSSGYLASVSRWLDNDQPYTTYSFSHLKVDEAGLGAVPSIIRGAKRSLLVIGRLHQRDGEVAAVRRLAAHLGWPVVTDIGSGLRLTEWIEDDHAVTHLRHIDLALSADRPRDEFECVLHIGGPLVSRRVGEFLKKQVLKQYVLVNEHPHRQDSTHQVTLRVESDVRAFAEFLVAVLPSTRPPAQLSSFGKTDIAIRESLAALLDSSETLSEPLIARKVAQEIPSGHGLFIASSLPIRDFNMYAPAGRRLIRIGCNRGASGIDGTIASAAGFARGLGQPVTLVIGDLAMLHDLNSLLLLSSPGTPPVTVIVINNGGGAIFSLLPIGELQGEPDSAQFERLFLQKHNLHFALAAEMLGLSYCHPASTEEFVKEYRRAVRGARSSIIELTFDWRESRDFRKQLQSEIVARLKKA